MPEQLCIGDIVDATVTATKPFGAFVSVSSGDIAKDGVIGVGMIHISELSSGYVRNTEDFISVGDKVKAKVVGFTEDGRLNLSMRQAEEPPEVPVPDAADAFEEMLERFKKQSGERLSDLKRYSGRGGRSYSKRR